VDGMHCGIFDEAEMQFGPHSDIGSATARFSTIRVLFFTESREVPPKMRGMVVLGVFTASANHRQVAQPTFPVFTSEPGPGMTRLRGQLAQ
jgi:hypothetical protein